MNIIVFEKISFLWILEGYQTIEGFHRNHNLKQLHLKLLDFVKNR